MGRSQLVSMAVSDLGSSYKTERQILQRASVSNSFNLASPVVRSLAEFQRL